MSSDSPEITIRVHTETLQSQFKAILGRKAKRILSDDVKRTSAEIYKNIVEKYVPRGETGSLRDSARVVKHKDTYGVEYDPVSDNDFHYARAQYEGDNGTIWPSSMWNRHTRNTYSHWNRHMNRLDREQYYDRVKSVILEKLNNG